VLHLYIFYSRLEKLFKNTLTLELENWTAPDEISIKNTEWRSHDKGRKRRRTEASSDSVDENNDGGSDNSGPVEADGFYDTGEDGCVDGDGFDNCNWFTKVTQWRASGDSGECGKVQGITGMGLDSDEVLIHQ
jgi:hypothetical protein